MSNWKGDTVYAMQHFAVHLVLLSCLLCLYYCPTAAQVNMYINCNTDFNYTSGSVYEQNLNGTLASLASNASLTGFYNTSVGQGLDVVYGLIQCRGDLSNKDCQTCANTAATQIRHLCFSQKEASIGYEDCSLQYSDWKFFSTVNGVPRGIFYNLNNATNSVLFNHQLINLVKNISSNAASNPSRFAIGVTGHKDFVEIIYGMAQCTRDLEENSCLSCLQGLISYIPTCCDKKVGARIFSMSCNLWYEIYPFFLSPLPSPPPEASSSHGKKSNSNTVVILVISVAVSLAVILIICGCFLWRITRRKRVGKSDHISYRIQSEGVCEDGDRSRELLSMTLSTLKVATRNFSDAHKLGEGGFGPVYKGKLLDGREIAVKRLSRSSRQGVEELKTEVMLVAKLLHRNLVRLLGFCIENEEKLLVYEYLPNGSLDKILFDQRKRFGLEWERRYKIIVRIARGLLYLHEDSQLRIVHRDLKASNILLDEYMDPKISDFGLARLFGGSQTQGNTNRIAGTHGYMAPEYAKNGYFSAKSDVYSFGVLVLEIVAGQKNSSFRNSMNLQSYAWKHWANGTALQLMDPILGDQWPRHEVLKCIHTGLLCVQESAADRPTMSEVVLMLSSYSIPSRVPLRPAFFPESEFVTQDSGSSQYDESKPEPLQQSVNDVTITELDPR